MIILLTNKFDISTDYIVKALRKRNQHYVRLNTEDLVNQGVEVTIPAFSINVKSSDQTIKLSSNIKAVLFRRPGKPFEFAKKDQKPSKVVARYVENQWHVFLESLCEIENVLWINSPINNHLAENKILQLKRAVALGFNVPRTCITSSKENALTFFKECEQRIIVKALYSPLIEYPKKDYFIYTTEISSLNGIPSSEFQLAPTIFQEAIDGKVDYRVTIIGNSCFAARIESPDEESVPIDWRLASKRLRYVPVTLPSEIERKCLKLVSDLKLVFGAIDLIEKDGKFYFLEINPNGEWGWLQKDANFPIADALADMLIEGCTL